MFKRLFDLTWSILGIIILSPVLLVCAILIKINSKGPILFKQVRVGKNNRDFKIMKFRTMYTDSAQKGLLTLGDKDPRVTEIGYSLRKYKLDELPQLFNVLFGTMSFVGPRPEVRKYVDLYTEQEKMVLKVQPGITDLASIKYRDETELLKAQENPEEFYIQVIMREKLKINLEYIQRRNFFSDIFVIFKTLGELR